MYAKTNEIATMDLCINMDELNNTLTCNQHIYFMLGFFFDETAEILHVNCISDKLCINVERCFYIKKCVCASLLKCVCIF